MRRPPSISDLDIFCICKAVSTPRHNLWRSATAKLVDVLFLSAVTKATSGEIAPHSRTSRKRTHPTFIPTAQHTVIQPTCFLSFFSKSCLLVLPLLPTLSRRCRDPCFDPGALTSVQVDRSVSRRFRLALCGLQEVAEGTVRTGTLLQRGLQSRSHVSWVFPVSMMRVKVWFKQICIRPARRKVTQNNRVETEGITHLSMSRESTLPMWDKISSRSVTPDHRNRKTEFNKLCTLKQPLNNNTKCSTSAASWVRDVWRLIFGQVTYSPSHTFWVPDYPGVLYFFAIEHLFSFFFFILCKRLWI